MNDQPVLRATTALTGAVMLLIQPPASPAADLFVAGDPPGFDQLPLRSDQVAWGDYDNDGLPDAYVVQYPISGGGPTTTNLLFRNRGGGTFLQLPDATIGGPAVHRDPSYTVQWGDLDNDGRLDLLIHTDTAPGQPPGQTRMRTAHFYLNRPDGQFTAVDAGDLSRLNAGGGSSPSLADYDQDGWIDIFLPGVNPKNNGLFHSRGDGAFTAVTDTTVTSDLLHALPVSGLWSDIDGDGDQDLVVAYFREPTPPSVVYRNDGAGQFTRLSRELLGPTVGVANFQAADFDRDGDLDLVAAGEAVNILLNPGNGEFQLGQRFDLPWGHAFPADYDNDGDTDILIAGVGSERLAVRLLSNDGTGHFTQVTEAFTGPTQASGHWVDVDNDGFLDLFLAYREATHVRHVLYKNQGNGNHWIKFRLVGTASNRSAFGAKVRVKATIAGATVWQLLEHTHTFASGDALRLHFGLGDATVAEEVRVEWPSGNVDTLRNLPVNRIMNVTETTVIRPARPVATANGTVSFGKPTGQAGETYQWYLHGEPLPDRTDRTLNLTAVQPSQAGRYSLVTRNGVSSATNHVHLRVLASFTKVLEGEIVTEEFGSDSAVWFDMNNDGWLDVFVPHDWDYRGLADSLYRNNPDGTFGKILDSPVTVRPRGSTVASAADFDNDGHVDLFVNRAEGHGELFRNQAGGAFVAVPGPFNTPHGQGFASSWGDYDRDGDLDLLVAYGYADKNDPEALYRNNGDRTFTELTAAEVGSLLSDRFVTWTCALSDLDNDGWPDALVQHLSGLRLHRNNRDGTFTRVARGSLANSSTDDMFTLGDYDNDGDLDILATRLSRGTAGIHRNLGQFTFEFVSTAGDLTSSKLPVECYPAWGDYDNDGWLDLFVAGYTTTNLMFRNRGDGTFQTVDAGNLSTDGVRRSFPLWVDYDNNGFLDLMLTCGDFAVEEAPGVPNHLYRNAGNSNHWLKVKLVGTTSNRDGVGAKIRLNATIHGRTFDQMREIAGYAAWVGTVPLMAHFGLGDATHATSVRIEWPSGIVQELAHVTANRMLTVTEPELIQLTCSSTPDGLQITCRGLPNTTYELLSSSNLNSWTNVTGPLATDATGTATRIMPEPQAARFYRAVRR